MTVFAGLLPAARATRISPVDAVREGVTQRAGPHGTRCERARRRPARRSASGCSALGMLRGGDLGVAGTLASSLGGMLLLFIGAAMLVPVAVPVWRGSRLAGGALRGDPRAARTRQRDPQPRPHRLDGGGADDRDRARLGDRGASAAASRSPRSRRTSPRSARRTCSSRRPAGSRSRPRRPAPDRALPAWRRSAPCATTAARSARNRSTSAGSTRRRSTGRTGSPGRWARRGASPHSGRPGSTRPRRPRRAEGPRRRRPDRAPERLGQDDDATSSAGSSLRPSSTRFSATSSSRRRRSTRRSLSPPTSSPSSTLHREPTRQRSPPG